MSNRNEKGKYCGGDRQRHQKQSTSSSVAKEAAASLLEGNPVLAMFKKAAGLLNERQDRHERLVKLSRDVTIESKRIIFLLHSAINETERVVIEAKERLEKLAKGSLRSIGLELEKSPAYLHMRAVTAGLQEYVEARTLCSLMEKREIICHKDMQNELTYSIKSTENVEREGEALEHERQLVTLLPQNEYMLGVADLTGEMMRRCINFISSGESKECFFACQILRDIYTGYLGLFGIGKELSRKMSTTRTNVLKVESAVYALRVRGQRAPLKLLEAPTHDEDEGFY